MLTPRIDRDGAYLLDSWSGQFNPYIEEKVLARLFPELEEAAGLDMEWELRNGESSRNVGRESCGPAFSQLFTKD